MTISYDNPIYATDAYKLDHRRQYPKGTTLVQSNWTPRSSRLPGVDYAVHFGLQAFLKKWLSPGGKFDQFFNADVDELCADYEATTTSILGPNQIGSDHIRALHNLGYIPLIFKSLPEGTKVPLRVPAFIVENTHPDFFWLVNYFETVMSAELWQASVSATQAYHLRQLGNEWAVKTGAKAEDMAFTFHDFSMRGQTSNESAAASGAGHLLSSNGTDTIPSLKWIGEFYPTDQWIGGSVAATEHSVMCAGGKEDEIETFQRLLDLYPSGIVSVVSDTWDLWNVLTNILPQIKDQILARDGKLVIRPDSGDPVDILTGMRGVASHQWDARRARGYEEEPYEKGVIELLWDTFGGTVNDDGYKVLDSHIGAIYGDAITYDRANEIFRRLEAKGFVATNVVLGIGSYTYQYVTRDTLGYALKATFAIVDGEPRNLKKDPVTDYVNGVSIKESATGRLAVLDRGEGLVLVSRATLEDEANSLLRPVWADGKFVKTWTFDEVRNNLNEPLDKLVAVK
jgi:nicotinic acid phosphoribosyltransferase